MRSYNILRYLSSRHDIHLGAFVDDVRDRQYTGELERYCKTFYVRNLNPKWSRIKSLKGFLFNSPLSLPYYFDAKMKNWVDRIVSQNSIDHIFIFSSQMAQYAPDDKAGSDKSRASLVVDFVDVDSEKWRQYATEHKWPFSWIYRREGQKLLAYERNIANRAQAAIFVSSSEAEVFTELVPEAGARTFYVENGVDTEYFDPRGDYPQQYGENRRVIVFTGAMDYWANADAVIWFANEVFPRIRQQVADAEFYIVGANPLPTVLDLNRIPGVCVTGSVADVRPYLAYACLAVAPLRIARGVQNKVLEAMAMEKPVVATSMAMEGIEIPPGLQKFVADDIGQMVKRIVGHLADAGRCEIGIAARAFVLENYNWDRNLAKLNSIITMNK